MPSRAKTLRDLINGPNILVTPGVYDGFSVRLVESLGFKSAAISGAGLSEGKARLGRCRNHARASAVRSSEALAACSTIPLTADADTGYGNAINVHFTIKGFERAGIAGVMDRTDLVWAASRRCVG